MSSNNKWMRQSHRWFGIAFTVTVLVCIVAISISGSPIWVFYLPLLPLGLQVLTGLYLFALPYATKRRNGQRAVPEA